MKMMCLLATVLLPAVLSSCTEGDSSPRPLETSRTPSSTVASCSASGPATQDIILSDQLPESRTTVRVGDVFAVLVGDAHADVTVPKAHPANLLCLASVTPRDHTRTAIFVALHPGSVYIGATITGVAGGRESSGIWRQDHREVSGALMHRP